MLLQLRFKMPKKLFNWLYRYPANLWINNITSLIYVIMFTIFKDYDFVIGPTTTTTAYLLTDPMDDPSKSFMDDVLVIPVNMAGLPGLNMPIGFDKNHMPIGMQIIANSFEEAKIYQLASALEKELNLELNPNAGGDNND